MRINNNIMAMNTHRQYNIANNSVASSAEKLSSGYRINRAGDDAAGLAISEKMRAQIRGLNMASKNSQDAISLVQTAEGALQSTHDILQRMRELAVQSASDTNEKTVDRGAINQEFQALKAEINDIASKTVFNDQALIDGTFAATKYSIKVVSGAFMTASGASAMVGKAAAGTYSLTVVQRTTGYTAAQNATGVASAGSNKAIGLVTFAGGTALNSTAAYNGTWTLGFNSSNSTFELKLGSRTITASVPTGTIGGTTGTTGTMALDFGAFGVLTINGLTSQYNVNKPETLDALANAVDGVTVSVGGGVDYNAGVTRFYAQMTGAQDIELGVGDTSLTFTNGITINFKALDANELKRSETLTGGVPTDSQYTALNAKLTGSFSVNTWAGSALTVQTGANQGDELRINIDKMDANVLGIFSAKADTRLAASYAITQVNNAINQVSTQRAALGALQNRLNYKISNLDTSAENLQSAESRIRDVDMAKEMTDFTKKNILVQASTAMLAQANSAPQNVLSLLR